jgi:hypothetical protein
MSCHICISHARAGSNHLLAAVGLGIAMDCTDDDSSMSADDQRHCQPMTAVRSATQQQQQQRQQRAFRLNSQCTAHDSDSVLSAPQQQLPRVIMPRKAPSLPSRCSGSWGYKWFSSGDSGTVDNQRQRQRCACRLRPMHCSDNDSSTASSCSEQRMSHAAQGINHHQPDQPRAAAVGWSEHAGHCWDLSNSCSNSNERGGVSWLVTSLIIVMLSVALSTVCSPLPPPAGQYGGTLTDCADVASVDLLKTSALLQSS